MDEMKWNWLDRLIDFFDPEEGTKRKAWRAAGYSYDAGNYERSNANWYAFNQSAELTDKYDRDTVRARARDLERNSDMFNAVIGAFKRNVIGGGYTVQAKTGDEELNTRLEKLWARWSKRQNCDVTGTQNFDGIIRMCVVRKKVDGGILICKRYTERAFLPLQLQLFEVDELDVSQVQPHREGNKVVGGIEYDRFNRPEGYHIRQYDIDGNTAMQSVFIDAKYVFFYFGKKRPSQIREISDMSPSIGRIRDMNEFMEAVSVKERVIACLSVFIKRIMPPAGGYGRTQGGTPEREHSYQGKTLTPGMIKELNAGDEIQVVNPTGQGTDAASYIKLQERLTGAGVGISYEASSRDMSETNYSSARQAIIEDEYTYAEEIELLEELLDEIYESFVIACVLAGAVDISDFWENKETYLSHIWVRAPKKWIDPLKEANANRIAIQTGQKGFKEVAAEQGKDWKDVIDDIAETLAYAEEKGVNLDGILYEGKAEFAKDDASAADKRNT